MIQLPKSVSIVEVGPRDGLQNESKQITTSAKIHFINMLSETGLQTIEVTGFVSPKKIPQLSDSQLVFKSIQQDSHINYPVIVPNIKGLENAISAGVKSISFIAGASETFSQKNVNCSIEEGLKRASEVIALANNHKIKVRGYVSCAFGCPYEGDITTDAVLHVSKSLIDFGCYEVALGDTIGVATPRSVINIVEILTQVIPTKRLAMHFHDTYGQALTNIYTALQAGINTFDASVAGLGGCPYAKGSSGNVATEDVIYLMDGLGIETNVNLNKLIEAGQYICNILGISPRSKVNQAKTSS